MEAVITVLFDYCNLLCLFIVLHTVFMLTNLHVYMMTNEVILLI